MKNIWGIVLSLVLMAGCHTSKRPVLYHLSEESQPAVWSTLRYQYPQADGVYLYYKRSISHDLKPDFKNNAPRWYFFESFHWKEAVLQDRAGDEHPPFEVALAAHEEIRDAQIRIIREDATEHRYSKRNLSKQRIDGDSTRFWLDESGLEEGATIEVAYEIERKELYDAPPLSHDVAFQQDRPMEHYSFDFTYPRDWNIQIKRVGIDRTMALAESRQEKEETITLHYAADRVPAFTSQDYRPYFKEVAPYFHVQMLEFEVGNVLAYRAPDAWDQIAQRFRPYAGDYSKRITGKAKDVIEALDFQPNASESTKLAAILAHVETEIERSKHGDTGTVAKEGRGNAYAITAYTKALLDEVGIAADYMIAHSAEGGFFDHDFVTSEQLYMPLLQVEHASRPLYLFPALRRVPAGYIPPAYERQPAITFAEADFQGLETIPGSQRTAYSDRSKYDVFVNYDGSVRVEATLELGAYSAYLFNTRLHAATDEHTERLAKALLPHDSSLVSGFVYRIQEAGFNRPMQMRADYTLEGCFDDMGDEFMLRSCGLFDPASTTWHPFDPERTAAIQLPADVTLNTEVSVTYPAQWTLATSVSNIDERSAKARLRRRVDSDDGSLRVEQQFTLNQQLMQPMEVSVALASMNMDESAHVPFLELSNSVWASVPSLGEIEKGGPWTLVVGSFDTQEEAEAYAYDYSNKMMKKGYPISILADEEGEKQYRVVVGTFATRTSVETALHMLNEEIPFDTWMLGLKKPLTATTGKPGPIKQ